MITSASKQSYVYFADEYLPTYIGNQNIFAIGLIFLFKLKHNSQKKKM